MVWLTKLTSTQGYSLRILTDQSLHLPKKGSTNGGSTDFPTPEDVQVAINMIGSGRLRLRLFLKSLETILGISDLQLDFVELIGRKKVISPSDLATELDVNKATISGHLEKLIENNLLQESPSPEDKRKKLFSLTDQGIKLYDIINILESRILSRLLAFVGPETFHAVNEHVSKIGETIDAKKQVIKTFVQARPEGIMQILMEVPTETIVDNLSQVFPFLLGDGKEDEFKLRGDL